MGYAPISRVEAGPDPADTGLTLSVERDAGDRFPRAPFTALVWPVQTIPTVGVDSEEVMVVNIDHDEFTIERGVSPIDITEGLQISVLRTMPIYNESEQAVISHDFGDNDPPYIVSIRSSQGDVVNYGSAEGVIHDDEGIVAFTFVPGAPGLWHTRIKSASIEAPEQSFFTSFSDTLS